MSGIVIVLIQSLELVDLVFTTSEERPENLDQREQEDDTCSDGDRDEDDDTRREEICYGGQSVIKTQDKSRTDTYGAE